MAPYLAALGELRQKGLKLDVEQSDPLEGLLQLFDFLCDYFEVNPGLVRLLNNANLLVARFMRHSAVIREMSSPMLSIIDQLIKRGAVSGQLAPDLDALRLYVFIVALKQFRVLNVQTLSVIFDRDLTDKQWCAARKADACLMLRCFLITPDSERRSEN